MTHTNRQRASRKQLIMRCLFYTVLIVIAPLMFFGIGFMALDRWGHDGFIRWGGFTIFTMGLFGLFIAESGQLLLQWRFWGFTAIILAIHTAVFIEILLHIEEWKLTWFVIMALEYPVFLSLRRAFVDAR